MSDPAESPPVTGAEEAPSLPDVDSPPAEEVLDGAPSKDDVVGDAPSPEDIVAEQPSVDEILRRER
jgi:hypothetical protein